jgi:hypothetical protein
MSGRKRQPFFAHFAGDKSRDWYEGTERNQSLHGHRNTLRSGVDLSGTIHDLDDSHALLIGDGQLGAPRGECSEVVRRSSATMAAPMARSTAVPSCRRRRRPAAAAHRRMTGQLPDTYL